MDKKTAKQNLRELRDSLSRVLDGKEYQSSEEIKEQSKEAIQQARSASKQLKKSLLEKVKDLPVVQKVSELGTAGSVAVSTAAVAQTTVAVDQTEVFVASVANDVVEQRMIGVKWLSPRRSLRFPNYHRFLNQLLSLRTPHKKPLLLHKVLPPKLPLKLLSPNKLTNHKSHKTKGKNQKEKVHQIRLKVAIQKKIAKVSKT
jgi:hypothetical protein